MNKITLEAGHLPELVVRPTYYDRILEALKEADDGLTNHEICIKLNIKERRRVSEQVSAMKAQGIVRPKLCRSDHAPIYYFYK